MDTNHWPKPGARLNSTFLKEANYDILLQAIQILARENNPVALHALNSLHNVHSPPSEKYTCLIRKNVL